MLANCVRKNYNLQAINDIVAFLQNLRRDMTQPPVRNEGLSLSCYISGLNMKEEEKLNVTKEKGKVDWSRMG